MLRSECDKLYQGKCSCLGKSLNTIKLFNEEHWCSSQNTEATIIDIYHLPLNITKFVLSNDEISLSSRAFMSQIKDDKKIIFSQNIKKNNDGSTDEIIVMKWFKEADFLPSWIWMIESGYNVKRDQYHKENNVKFSKQIITKTANFTITEGPYTTNTNNPPYHVDIATNNEK
jgi:hypothetical protein